MDMSDNFETAGDIVESQKQWLRETSVAVISPDYAFEVYEYLKQLAESECKDVQLRMLIRGCSANLARQYPDKFCFDFLNRQKIVVLERTHQENAEKPLSSSPNSIGQEDFIQRKTDIKCPACGYLADTESSFCSKCGESLFSGRIEQESIAGYCSKCQFSLRASDHFCPKCGALGNAKPAGLIKRFCAIFIDAFALSILLSFTGYALMLLTFFMPFPRALPFYNGNPQIYFIFVIVGLFLFLTGIYYLVLEKTFKIGSLGKKLLGLSLISKNRKDLPFSNLLVRHMVRMLELFFVFMGGSFNAVVLSYLLGKVVPLYPHELRYIIIGIYLIILVFFISHLLREKKFFHDSWSSTIVIEG